MIYDIPGTLGFVSVSKRKGKFSCKVFIIAAIGIAVFILTKI